MSIDTLRMLGLTNLLQAQCHSQARRAVAVAFPQSFQQQSGTCIPPFSDYNDIFANELAPSYFAGYIRPADLPQSQVLVKMARAVYSYWRERKIEREGQRIIPTLNVCFSCTILLSLF